jgi:hypothetical protein
MISRMRLRMRRSEVRPSVAVLRVAAWVVLGTVQAAAFAAAEFDCLIEPR